MANVPFPLPFKRQFSGPLDQDNTFQTTAEMAAYLTSALRYAGQIVTCVEQPTKIFVMNPGRTAWTAIETGGGGAGPVAQVDATVDGTVVIDAGTTSLDFTGAYSSTKTIDCVNIADGATVAIHSIDGIDTVTLSGTGLTFTGSLTPFNAGQVGTLTRNGNVVHAAEPESVLNKVQEIVEPISIFTGVTQYPSLLATSVHTNKRLLMQDALSEFVVSGVVLTTITGLDAALSEGVAYFGGTLYQYERIAISAVASRTYTASKDTYVDLCNTNYGTYQIAYNVVDNGATAPPLATNAAYRIYKVVTDATDITSIENLANRQPTFKAPITVPDAVVAGDAANKGQLDAVAVQSITIVCSDETTALTAGAAKVTLRMPYAFTLQEVRASLTTAQTSGSIFTIDVNEAGASVFSTTLTIDNTAKTSTTATTPAVISDTALADDAEITIDIDQIGDGTAKGLKVYLIGVKA